MATKKRSEPMIKSNITIENARIGFRNFTGKEGQFNPAGQRNFCVFLEDDVAELFAADGWNIKHLKPKDPGDPPQAYLQVAVSYANYAPKITLITGTGKNILDEDTVNILDWADIDNVDLIIRPYNWEVNQKKGVKAYLKTMYVTITEDEFADKYRNVPDSAMSSPDEEVLEEN
jgi:hypothetical protein